MKKRLRTPRRDLPGKVSAIVLATVFLAGCSSGVERFGESPYYTANTNNQREILGSSRQQPSYQDIVDGSGGTVQGLPAASSAPVTTSSVPSGDAPIRSAPLPAPTHSAALPGSVRPGATSMKLSPVETTPAPEVVQTRVAPAVAAPVAQPQKAVTWKGWTSSGGTMVSVRKGDTLNSVARRYGVPIQAIAAVNGISDPNSVREGQSVVVPTYVYSERNGSSSTTEGELKTVKLPSASKQDAVVTGSVPIAPEQMRRPVQKPYSQPSFAQLSGPKAAAPGSSTVSASSSAAPVVLASVQPKRKPKFQRPLTTASVPVAGATKRDPAPRRLPLSKPADVPALVAAPSGAVMKEDLPAKPVQRAETQKTPEAAPTQIAKVEEQPASDGAKFRWPVRGRIISDFGAKPGGGRNEGVNLAVPEGTPVKAADTGSVIYSGNELKGYGNLVLVRHGDGWVSAYAHNSELKVRRGDKVRRGEVLALAGKSGSVNQPQVHFELRRGNKPVDPLKHLPRR